MSGPFAAFSSAERAIANAKMNHSRSHSPVCGGYEYGWIGHKPGSGFSDQTPAALEVFASLSLDRF
jgi:hypothetical protein